MTLPEIAFACAIVFIGLPSAIQLRPLRLRNLTALALVVAWVVNQIAWKLTGGADLTQFYMMSDMTVIAMIFCKRDGGYPSKWDRAVLAVFAVMWCIYAFVGNPYLEWLLLWWLALAQFLCAGGESIQFWLARHMAKMPRRETSDKSELLRWGEAYG